MYISNRYCNPLAKWLDQISYFLMMPWLTVCSQFVSCYITTIQEKQEPQKKLYDYFLLGPMYGIFLVLFLPAGIMGIIIWIFICENFEQDSYIFLSCDVTTNDQEDDTDNLNSNVYTIASANVLLAPEVIARLNNNKNTNSRISKIAETILNHTDKPLFNLIIKDHFVIPTKYETVCDKFPKVDFLCLQEVWERDYSLKLIDHLKKEFSYFLYDIGEYSLRKNFCMLGSGLFFASRRPILDAEFNTFRIRKKHARCTTQGVLCVKVFLHYGKNGESHIGYITNIHTQAFQGEDAVLLSQLTDILVFASMFKEHKTEPSDIIDFDIVCGDFNADNMSPADIDVQNHILFEEYEDICMISAGQDEDWAIGTELRQAMLFKPDIMQPEDFRSILVNDSLRRLYVLDADVLIHSTKLMTSTVQPDTDGWVEPVPWGGKRRVDKILSRGSRKQIVGYCFVSALTNLTDHLPVCMTLRV